jgi:hypothetical protein
MRLVANAGVFSSAAVATAATDSINFLPMRESSYKIRLENLRCRT